MWNLFYFSQHFHFQIDMRAFDIIYPRRRLLLLRPAIHNVQHVSEKDSTLICSSAVCPIVHVLIITGLI